jgi:MFS family permease
MLICVGCGLPFSFGIYQALYEDMANQPDTPFTGASSALIGLIGTLAVSLMTGCAPYVTNWTKIYSPRSVVCVGALVFAMANILASFGEKLWHFTLTQGILLGIGASMIYLPAVTVAPTWFDKRRGLALGIIVSGTGVGGVMWAPALRAMNESIGFRNALRVAGTVGGFLLFLSGLVMKWEPGYRERILLETQATSKQRLRFLRIGLINWRIARSKRFIIHALGSTFQSAAYSTPLFMYAAYAQSLGYSPAQSANFIAISNASNTIGKIAIGYAADRLGRLNALFLTTLISTVAVLGFWLPSALQNGSSGSHSLFITFTIFYGAFASAYVSLFPTSIIELFGIQNFAAVNGLLYMIRGIAMLIGTPLASLQIPRSQALTSPVSYEGVTIMVGVLMALSTLVLLWVRFEANYGSSSGWKL